MCNVKEVTDHRILSFMAIVNLSLGGVERWKQIIKLHMIGRKS